MRAALAWAEEAHDAELMLRLALALYWFWERRASLEETTSWLERTISVTEGVPERLRGQRARLLAMTAYCVTYKGDEHRAKKLVDDALLLAQEAGDAKASAMATLTLGQIEIRQSEWDRAKTYASDALARWRDLDEPDWIVGSLYLLGLIAMLQGEPNVAEPWFVECLAVAQRCGWPLYIAFGLEALGTCAREQGDLRRAVPLFAEALSLVQDGSDLGTVTNCLKSLGAVAAVAGNAEQAARLFGAAEATRERAGVVDSVAEQPRLEQAYAPARAKLSTDAFDAAWSSGREMPLSIAIVEALEVAHEFSSERPFGEESPTKLTPRELAVLRLLVEGLSDKEIAEALGITRSTASKHVETIRGKLGVPSRTAAATFATRHGLV
jgi:non-specific serine/threonine protein kinase